MNMNLTKRSVSLTNTPKKRKLYVKHLRAIHEKQKSSLRLTKRRFVVAKNLNKTYGVVVPLNNTGPLATKRIAKEALIKQQHDTSENAAERI